LLGDAPNHDASNDGDDDNNDETAINRQAAALKSRPDHENGDEGDGGEASA
jgi:hypothetical protein